MDIEKTNETLGSRVYRIARAFGHWRSDLLSSMSALWDSNETNPSTHRFVAAAPAAAAAGAVVAALPAVTAVQVAVSC